MENKDQRQVIKNVFLGIASSMRAMWFAAIDVLQLIVYSFLLHALMFYYNDKALVPVHLETFSELIAALAQNWQWFFIIFVIWRVYQNLKYE